MSSGFDETVDALLATSGLEATIAKAPEATIKPSFGQTTAATDALRSLETFASVEGPDRVTLEGVLGEGGMGQVHLGTQVTLGRAVAVKTLKAEQTGERNALALLREAWITGALEHPNVVPVHEVDVDAEGRPNVVLRRIRGHSWRTLIADPEWMDLGPGKDELQAHLDVLVELTHALEYAHSKGIVHRDLKPENVMIGPFGEVYLLDWGIAVAIGEADPRWPRATESAAGTPAYMAPEQLGGRAEEIGPRTDVYLLGACLYEVLLGRPPHTGQTTREMLSSVLTSRPELPDAIPAEMREICQRAMAARPEDRHPSVREFRDALQRFTAHRGSAGITRKALQRLDTLQRAVESGGEVQDLFGACQFGFRQALESWPENPEARAGLDEACTLMARHALEEADDRAAAKLLAQVESPDAELVTAVEAARGKRESEALRLAELDPSVGAEGRMKAIRAMGVIAAVAPILDWGVETALAIEPTHRGNLMRMIMLCVVAGGVAAYFHRRIPPSRFNTALLRAVLVSALTILVWTAAAPSLGLDPRMTQVVHLGVWASLTVMIIAVTGINLWPAAAMNLGGFALAVAQPEWVYACIALANSSVVLNALWLWGAAAQEET